MVRLKHYLRMLRTMSQASHSSASHVVRRPFPRRRTEQLDYIQAMLGQLRTMAKAERCDMLAYLIEMSYVEASDIIRGERPSTLASTLDGDQRYPTV